MHATKSSEAVTFNPCPTQSTAGNHHILLDDFKDCKTITFALAESPLNCVYSL